MSRERPRLVEPPAPGAVPDESAPTFTPPQLATLVKEAPRGDGWLHELKLDGYRILTVADGERTTLFSRNKKRWTEKLPSLARDAEALGRRLVLDGEAVILDDRGLPSFEALVEGIHHGRESEVVLLAFDLLWLDGWDLKEVPLEERKRVLRQTVAEASTPRLRYLDHVVGQGAQVFQAACESGAEGIVSKRRDAHHSARRGASWRKLKCTARQELLVVGWTSPSNPKDHFGSLVLAVYDEGKLRYAGRVGTGFSREERRSLYEQLEARQRSTPPLDEVPKEPSLRRAHWSEPGLVAEIELGAWTKAGHVRHPSFIALREDKAPSEVVRERPEG